MVPGVRGQDRQTRRHALQDDLRQHGADDVVASNIDAALAALEPCGLHVLLTANAESAAFCWLTDYEVPSAIRVGPTPALLPALAELSDRAPVVGAIIDHLGADLFELGHLDLVEIGSVEGEDLSTDRHVGGNQDSYQQWVNTVYERNADLIAKHVSEHAERARARVVVLTGTHNEVASVEQRLGNHRFAVSTVNAGDRNDKAAPGRLDEAAREAALTERSRRRNEAVEKLAQELGQHDLAVAGYDETVKAISESRVETLFIDPGKLDEGSDADSLARDALLFGGGVVVAPDLQSADGVAGLLRFKST